MFSYPEEAWRASLGGPEKAPAGAGAGAGAGGPAEVDEGDWRRLEEDLNRRKTALEKYPPDRLRAALASLDPYAAIRREVGRRLDLGPKEATNATLKFLELAEAAGVPGPGPTRAFCNAELPGAFVAALNALHRGRPAGEELDWVASSLYPEGGAELGDSAGLYRRNRHRWLMGPPPNGVPAELKAPPLRGDVTSADDVAGLALAVRLRFPPSGATLYTSDAGTDVAADPNAAEEATAWLHFGQTACGLLALAPGGAFVVKTYTFFRPASRALLALLATRFERLELLKPLASRAANSEVYVVGRGFRGCPPPLRERLLGALRGRRPGEAPPALTEVGPEADRALFRAAAEVHAGLQARFLEEAAARAACRRGGPEPEHRRLQAAWLEKRGLP